MTVRTPLARTLARTIGLITAAAAVFFGGTSLASTMAHEKRPATTIPLPSGIGLLDLRSDSGVMIIDGGIGGATRLIQTIHTGLTSPEIAFGVIGSTAIYTTDCRWFDDRCSVDLTAAVNPAVPVTVSSTGGDIRVRRVDSTVAVDSSGGDVTVQDATGDLDLRSSAGDVHVFDSGPSNVTAHSSGGDVQIRLVTSPKTVIADSSGGEVLVVLPNDPTRYRVEASSSGGETQVQVQTDPNSENVIRVSSSGGDVTVRYAER
jgi:Putative adhesin